MIPAFAEPAKLSPPRIFLSLLDSRPDINPRIGTDQSCIVLIMASAGRRFPRTPSKVLYRLKKAGYAAFIVGGGVRDLLLGLNPKDFDVVTDALPDEVRSLVPQFTSDRTAVSTCACSFRA